MDETPAKTVGGMRPWLCRYKGADGAEYGITLYGTDPDQVLEDNCGELAGLQVDGELISTIPVDPGDEGEILRNLGKR